MSKTEQEEIKKAKDLLTFVLTIEDLEITLSTIEAVIEILDDLA
jgi:hypothetical protein